METCGEVGENFLDLSCESAILISQDTGEVLYEHNAHEEDGKIVYDEIAVGNIPETNNAELIYDEEKDEVYAEVV